MKVIASIIAMLFAASVAFATEDLNWNKSEHNLQIESGDWGFEVRTYLEDDYDHMEVSKKIGNGLTAAVRYAEDGTDTEIRPKLTHKLLDAGMLSLAHRAEYRYHTGSADDNWRYRAIIGLKQGNAWVTLQPRWELGGDKENDSDIDNVKWQAGWDWTLDKSETASTVLTPFIEYQTEGADGDWKKTHMIFGTNLTVKF